MDEQPEQRSLPLRRRLLAAAVALVPVIPIIVGLTITSGGVRAQPLPSSSYAPVSTSPAASSATTSASTRSIPGGSGVLVAVLRRPTRIRATPGGRVIETLPLLTPFGSPQTMWVLQRHESWLGVLNPLLGNGHVGWIYSSTVSLERVAWEIRVSLAARRLTVIDRGHVVQRDTVAIGQPAAPTPTGRFYVTDRLTTGNPAGPYGCCILALSARSPHAIQGWGGGDRIAVHSTPDTASIGLPVSHGCLRLTLAEGRWLLAHVPIGTPALIAN